MRLLASLTLSALLTACTATTPPPDAPTVPLPPAAPSPAAPVPPSPAPSPAPPRKPFVPARPPGVPGTAIRFTGGAGSSLKDAIVIEGAEGEMDGVRSEYQYLDMLLGPRPAAWTMVKQSLLDDSGKRFDALEISRQGKSETYYFDITGYFGK